MQHHSIGTPSSSTSSFAGVLASLAAPPQTDASPWDESELAEDIATLSYEQALRTHGRYHPSEAHTGCGAAAEPAAASHAPSFLASGSSKAQPDAHPEKLKTASIT